MSEETRRPVRIAGFNVVELVGGGVICVMGIAAAVTSVGYGLGSLRSVGPGMFPMCLGIVLAFLGVAVMFDGRTSMTTIPRVPWRPIIAISLGLVAFGLLIEKGGSFIAILALVFISGLAEPKFRPGTLGMIALGACLFMAALVWAFYGAISIPLLPGER